MGIVLPVGRTVWIREGHGNVSQAPIVAGNASIGDVVLLDRRRTIDQTEKDSGPLVNTSGPLFSAGCGTDPASATPAAEPDNAGKPEEGQCSGRWHRGGLDHDVIETNRCPLPDVFKLDSIA